MVAIAASATASASTTVDAEGHYSFSGNSVAADVQAMLDDPASNFGWLLRAEESLAPTAKRFGSRENADAGQQPALTISFGQPAVSVATLPALGAGVGALLLTAIGVSVRRAAKTT